MDVKARYTTHKLLIAVREIYGAQSDMAKQDSSRLSCGGKYIPSSEEEKNSAWRKLAFYTRSNQASYFLSSPAKMPKKIS